MERFDVVVIGGGQSGLATGYYLRRSGLRYVLLDNQKEGGGAWLHAWNSLQLFSPSQWSSLPGMLMTGGSNAYPSRDTVIDYLKYYETKYELPVRRPVEVFTIEKSDDEFIIHTSKGIFHAKAVVSATGSFRKPYIPAYPGMDTFRGDIIHSSQYQTPEQFHGKRVAVIGEGNSGAQIVAELSRTTATRWITLRQPRFLPDHIDGRYLFDAATQMYEAQRSGKEYKAPSLGDIVMVESVKDARRRNVLHSLPPFEYFTEDSLVWENGHRERIDSVIFCTGFRPALDHLDRLHVVTAEGKVETAGTRSKAIRGLWLVGYGNWTGFASATLIGVGRSAKVAVEQIAEYVTTINESKAYGYGHPPL